MNKKSLYTVQDADNLKIEDVVKLYKNYINPNQSQIFSSLPYGKDLFESAKGVHIHTSNGKKILDFTGGLGVLGLGHNHQRILDARIKFQKENKNLGLIIRFEDLVKNPYEKFKEIIDLIEINGPYDGVLMSLHGAAVSEDFEDMAIFFPFTSSISSSL